MQGDRVPYSTDNGLATWCLGIPALSVLTETSGQLRTLTQTYIPEQTGTQPHPEPGPVGAPHLLFGHTCFLLSGIFLPPFFLLQGLTPLTVALFLVSYQYEACVQQWIPSVAVERNMN